MTVALVLILIATGLNLVLVALHLSLRNEARQHLDAARSDVEEMRRINCEIAEAFALFDYGAVDEGIETLRRCSERHRTPGVGLKE